MDPDASPIPHRLWQVAGALGLAHIVLIPVGIALQQSALFADGTAGIRDRYVEGDFARTASGGMLEAFGFLLLLPALVFLARALGRRTEVGRWAAQSGLMCGVAYVAVTFAVGFPAGAAAMYGAQHGLDVDAAFALNNVRIFGYFLSLLLLGGEHARDRGLRTQRRCPAPMDRRLRSHHWSHAARLDTVERNRAAGLGHPGLDGLVRRGLLPAAPPPRGPRRRAATDSHERRCRAPLIRGGRCARSQSVGGVARRWSCGHRRAGLAGARRRQS